MNWQLSKSGIRWLSRITRKTLLGNPRSVFGGKSRGHRLPEKKSFLFMNSQIDCVKELSFKLFWNSIIMSTNNSRANSTCRIHDLSEEQRERERQRGRINRQRTSEEQHEREQERARNRRQNSSEQQRDAERARNRERRQNNCVPD